jgi:DNA replication protein DnaC
LIIDELGYVPLSQTGAELLFEVFSQRYERGSAVPLHINVRANQSVAANMTWVFLSSVISR